jgi:hypothetical protein
MKKIGIILIITIVFQIHAQGQENDSTFYLYYGFAGMGTNRGTLQPTIRINGTNLLYTFEQNSILGGIKFKSPDTILQTTIRQTSVDSILLLIKDVSDTNITQLNHYFSGGIHNLCITYKRDTTKITLYNAQHKAVSSIFDTLNLYLPENKKLEMFYPEPGKIEELFELQRRIKDEIMKK